MTKLRTAAGGAARQKYEDKGYADAAASESFRISECPYADGWQRDAWQAGAWRWMEEQRKRRRWSSRSRYHQVLRGSKEGGSHHASKKKREIADPKGRWIPPTIRLPNYSVKTVADPYRGGYEALLIGDGIGVLMQPNGDTPGLALMTLIRELHQGGDVKLAAEIERAAIWLPPRRRRVRRQ